MFSGLLHHKHLMQISEQYAHYANYFDIFFAFFANILFSAIQ